jgi:hypothetical protein
MIAIIYHSLTRSWLAWQRIIQRGNVRLFPLSQGYNSKTCVSLPYWCLNFWKTMMLEMLKESRRFERFCDKTAQQVCLSSMRNDRTSLVLGEQQFGVDGIYTLLHGYRSRFGAVRRDRQCYETLASILLVSKDLDRKRAQVNAGLHPH